MPATATPFGSTLQLLAQLYEFVGAVLGLFIAYLAYRGYRRNDSRPMLFLATGFVVIFAVPVPLAALALVTPSLPGTGVQVAVQTAEVLGLLCIVYALRVD